MLLSRKKYTKETFLNDFFKSMTPWLIKREDFIDWNRIFKSLKNKESFINDLENYDFNNLKKLEEQIKDTILSLDNPNIFIQNLFDFLWNTRNFFVSDQDNILFKNYIKDILKWDSNKAEQIAKAVVEIWFQNILKRENIKDYFIWLLVGFESDKRKNKWWIGFVDYIRPLLQKITDNFVNLKLVEEYVIKYEWENTTQNKKVDFAILDNWNCIIWIEVNFYTNSWSKPTEIKRSYWEVNRQLNNVWIELMWITDWFWYNMMKKSLWDAFEIHKNTYNYKMVENDFIKDLKDFLNLKKNVQKV